jgi:hypothetical protein
MATDPHTTDRVAPILALMKHGDDALNRRDKAAMDAANHPVAHITGNTEPIHGRDAHAAAMDAMFGAFPDVHIENDPYPLQCGQGDWITVVTKATGTFSGAMALPDGTVIPEPVAHRAPAGVLAVGLRASRAKRDWRPVRPHARPGSKAGPELGCPRSTQRSHRR